jgi:hypothetical protein
MFVYYHYPCNDGEMSKTLWQTMYPDATYIKYKHQNEYKELYNYKNEEIVFLDITPPNKYLLDCNKYLIIDHHKNAVETLLKNMKNNITLIYDFNKSACMLVWEYIFGDEPMISSVFHIGMKDMWNFSHPDTEPFCAYIETHYKMENFNNLLNANNIKKMIDGGRFIIKQDKEYVKNLMKNNLINIFIDTEDNYLILNIKFNGNKKYYKYIIEYAQNNYKDCDVLRINNHPTYSLRRLKDFSNGNPVNVDKIARKYGGNGHSGAAGYIFH